MFNWKLEMVAEPVIPAWSTSADYHSSGAELQRAIIRGFSDNEDLIRGKDKPREFEKTFTFKEHGEFFRGALTMAGLRHARDFYELLERYGSIKVTIRKREHVE